MARRRRDRWSPPEAVSLPEEARGGPAIELQPRLPVHAWLRTKDGRQMRVQALALWVAPDAVLVEWGHGQAAESAWIWRSAVKHRTDPSSSTPDGV